MHDIQAQIFWTLLCSIGVLIVLGLTTERIEPDWYAKVAFVLLALAGGWEIASWITGNLTLPWK